jgi:type II secretory pathway pseudopilin PulG
MLQLLSLFKSIPVKWLGVGVAILGLLIALGWQTYLKNSYKADLEKANAQIESLQQAVDALETSKKTEATKAELASGEADDMNSKLSQCYLLLEETRNSLSEIDAIMNTPEEELPEAYEPDKVQEFEPVTPSQTKRGLEFVNKQLERVK